MQVHFYREKAFGSHQTLACPPVSFLSKFYLLLKTGFQTCNFCATFTLVKMTLSYNYGLKSQTFIFILHIIVLSQTLFNFEIKVLTKSGRYFEVLWFVVTCKEKEEKRIKIKNFGLGKKLFFL